MTEKTCENCRYSIYPSDSIYCTNCIRNATDKFVLKDFTEIDRLKAENALLKVKIMSLQKEMEVKICKNT